MPTSPANTPWSARKAPARFADAVENIHRAMAAVWGVAGAFITLFVFSSRDMVPSASVALFTAAIVAFHLILAAGARRRSVFGRLGSIALGALMLAGFPVGTIVGGFLIYNASQPWPPRHVDGEAAAGAVDMRL